MTARYYGNGRSNLRWKLAMARLWLRHPLWAWRLWHRDGAVLVPPDTFGEQP